MDRAEAFKTLRLDQSADGPMIQAAYWMLVRHAQERSERDPEARREIEHVSDAYTTLAPDARHFTPPPRREPRPAPTGTEFVDRAVDWLAEEALRTRARWPGRNLEIGIIAGATLILMVLALGARASFWLTMAAVVATFVAIWAPWRRAVVDHTSADQQRTQSHRAHTKEPASE